MGPNVTANTFISSCRRMRCHSFPSPSWAEDMVLPWLGADTSSEHLFGDIVLCLSNVGNSTWKKINKNKQTKNSFWYSLGVALLTPLTFPLEMQRKNNAILSLWTSAAKFCLCKFLELLFLLWLYSLWRNPLSERHTICLTMTGILGLPQGVGAPEWLEGLSLSLGMVLSWGTRVCGSCLKLPVRRDHFIVNQWGGYSCARFERGFKTSSTT